MNAPHKDRKRGRERRVEPGSRYDDATNARRFVRAVGDTVRWVAAWKTWLVWDGAHWKVDRVCEVDRRAARVAASHYGDLERAVAGDPALDPQEVERWARYSNSHRGIRAMIELAKAALAIAPEELDRDPWLITTLDATINLRTGEAYEPRREDFITKQVPHRWNPEAECWRWKVFLGEVFQDRAEIVDFAQRWLGYTLTGDTGEHALVLAIGNGANGKSVFLETVRYVMGEDLATSAPPGLLLVQKGERHPTELRALMGRRLVIANELPKRAGFSEERVKSLTSSDTISARGMREDFMTFAPTHKIMIAANHAPRVSDASDGFWRRMRVLPFDVSFLGREDRSLPEKLRAEAEGILAWIVEGARLWAKEGLGEPIAMKRAAEAYRQEEDQIGRFLEDLGDIGERITSGELYEKFTSWAEDQGERAMSKKALGLELKAKGWIESRTMHSRGWCPPKINPQTSMPGLGMSHDES